MVKVGSKIEVNALDAVIMPPGRGDRSPSSMVYSQLALSTSACVYA